MGSSVARFDCYFARCEAEARIAASVVGPGLGGRRPRRFTEAGIDLDKLLIGAGFNHVPTSLIRNRVKAGMQGVGKNGHSQMG